MNDSSIIYNRRDIEFAWAAGFFDGEGCTYRSKGIKTQKGHKYPYSYFCMSVGQQDIYGVAKVLIRFQNAIGGIGNICGPFSRYKLPYYCWATQGNNAKQVLKLLWPYLGEIKREQAIKVGYRTPEIIYELMQEGKI